MNPITDICWHCLFPLHIASIKINGPGRNIPEPKPPNRMPICACGKPIPRIGLPLSYWEPVRLVDVTHNPYCFVNLGGMTMDLGISNGIGSKPKSSGSNVGTWHLHWYIYPAIHWLDLLTNFLCLEKGQFDVGYITELDPLWLDDSLSAIINPEAILFGNVIAQAACIVDCTAATARLPFDSLFWCAGCQGGMYPMNGRIQAHVGSIQSSLLAVERMTYKLHREGILWGTLAKGKSLDAWCKQKHPMPFMKKSMYRSQNTVPVPSPSCYPYGHTTIKYEAGKEIPVIGEDFGYLIWRKRECCVL